jgi:PAS domain S-box-containing protein
MTSMEQARSKKLIMVVDNHPLMLKYMRRLLEKRGDRVLDAEDGLAALKLLKHHRPDVMFVDQVMPYISGDKLCRIVRSRPDLNDTCIVVLSAIAAEADFNFSDFGANYCIAKGPFDKMSTHILALLYQLDAAGECGTSDRIIGREDVYYRQISKELLYSKRHSEIILDQIAEGIIELTMDGEIVYANPTAVGFFDIPEVQLLGGRFAALFSGEDHTRIEDRLAACCAGGETLSDPDTVTLNGRQISIRLVSIEDDVHKAITVIMNDITLRMKNEVAIKASEDHYRLMVEHLNHILFTTDIEGTFTYVNPAVEAISGYPPEEVVGRNFKIFALEEDLPLLERNFNKTVSGEMNSGEYRFRSKTGEIFWLRISILPLYEEDAIAGARGMATDITHTKLLQEGLIRSERLAATGQLAASIAHEINSPLQAIYSMLSSLRKRVKEDPEASGDIDMLKQAFSRISHTVNNLLDLNRPGEAGKQTANINQIIEKTVALVQSHLKKSRVDLHLDLSPEIPGTTLSPQRMSQVFLNIITNSVEALEGVSDPKEGWQSRGTAGGEIQIMTRLREGRICIELSDSGPGISDLDLDRIFDPFYTRKKKMGLGVGLTICHRIIEDHGGSITVQNRPGAGVMFAICLPVA